MAENVHTALQRSGVVERRQLDAVDPGLLLLDAEVVHGLLEAARLAKAAHLEQVFGAASHVRLTVT